MPSQNTCVPSAELVWLKERTDSHKSSFALCIYTTVHICPHTHIYTQNEQTVIFTVRCLPWTSTWFLSKLYYIQSVFGGIFQKMVNGHIPFKSIRWTEMDYSSFRREAYLGQHQRFPDPQSWLHCLWLSQHIRTLE